MTKSQTIRKMKVINTWASVAAEQMKSMGLAYYEALDLLERIAEATDIKGVDDENNE